jgi:hypothetical protein
VGADSALRNFVRSFGSAVKLRSNVTAALAHVAFHNNTIRKEDTYPESYGPDLFLRAWSEVMLRNVSFSDPQADAPERPLRARIAKFNGTSHVYRAAGGEPGGEAQVEVYCVDTEQVEQVEAAPAGPAADRFPSAQTPWYQHMMEVRGHAGGRRTLACMRAAADAAQQCRSGRRWWRRARSFGRQSGRLQTNRVRAVCRSSSSLQSARACWFWGRVTAPWRCHTGPSSLPACCSSSWSAR